MRALVFAGQGAETPGMGLPMAERSARARRLFELASDTVTIDVPKALERGSRALERTEVLQPVLVAVGLATAYALEERVGLPAVVLGHSLGELTAALYARGVDDARALAIAKVRGEAMAEAARSSPGGMLATLGDAETLGRARALGLTVAAENAPDEVVVAGSIHEIRQLTNELGNKGRPLRVGGAWHTAQMAGAAAPLEEALRGALGERRCGFVTATTGMLVPQSADIVTALCRGLTMPVRFTRALNAARGASPHFVAVCPGRVTRSLIQRTLKIDAMLLDDLADLDAIALSAR